LQVIFNKVRQAPKKMIFAEGEQEQVIRAAIAYKDAGLGDPILIGRDEIVLKNMEAIGFGNRDDLEIANTSKSDRIEDYGEYLYDRLQRKGFLHRDVMRMVSNDRNIFGSCMLALGDADAMITGVTRNYSIVLEQVTKAIDPKPGKRMIGVSMIITRGRTVLVADTNVHDMPNGEELADIAELAAETARSLGYEPRVAMLAYSTYGHPEGDRSRYVRDAVSILQSRDVDFEFDGEMAADVALNREARKLYPFSKLKDNANVLVMPAIHSASIATKMLGELGGATIVGPMLVGLSKPVQIVRIGCTSSELLNMAAIAAYDF
jgi:malate dehydrogenase (oxaloacetate-decarboxylating)(NADP+)